MNDIRTTITDMTVPVTATLREAMKAIDKGMLGLALVQEPATGVFGGLVTDGDLRRALLAGAGLQAPLSQVRRSTPITVNDGTSAEAIADLTQNHRHVRCVPVLDTERRVVDLIVLDSRPRLPVSEPHLGEQELQNVIDCVLSGWISSAGSYVGRFEEGFAGFCGSRHGVSVSSGTAALHLALRALDIGPGDEVIVPALTFVATANAVTYAGATPVFADVEPTTWNLDPDQIERLVTPRTRAVIPVHLYGHPADMDPIMEKCRRLGLQVIEDAAEAHGARYKGRTTGTLGTLGCFSFYGNKILTTGEGGMVVTDRADLAERVRLLRDHGMAPAHSYRHPVLGFNYRMTNLQAAVGVAQVEKAGAILQVKRDIARTYARHLDRVPGISLPPQREWAENVFWLYTVRVDAKRFGKTRDELREHLNRHRIDSRPVFPPLHTQPIYATGTRLPVAEKIAEEGLSLPSAVTMKSVEIQRIAAIIADAGKR